MGFSCEIWQGDKKLTGWEKEDVIHPQLMGYGPNYSEASDAPYRCNDLRDIVCSARYADRLPEAAQDCFRALQAAMKVNLDSLVNCHCSTCTCPDDEPIGWSVEEIKKVLAIDPKTITSISGGY